MKYYAIYNEQTKELSKAQCKQLNAINIEISEEVYNDFDKYTYIDGEIVLDENYEEKQRTKERQRLSMLKLTRGDVFRGLLQAKGITRTMLRATIEAMPETTQQEMLIKEMALIDFDEALDFYRGNALIDTVGAQLGITQRQLDNFFETNDYTKLIEE